jgi:hypothetical protein
MDGERPLTEWTMDGERTRTLKVKFDDVGTMFVVVQPVGETPVSDAGIVAKLSTITSSIERVSHDMLDAVRKAGPTKATVELGFGLAVEAGQIVALFGKGRGEASIKVTLEWSRDYVGPQAGITSSPPRTVTTDS